MGWMVMMRKTQRDSGDCDAAAVNYQRVRSNFSYGVMEDWSPSNCSDTKTEDEDEKLRGVKAARSRFQSTKLGNSFARASDLRDEQISHGVLEDCSPSVSSDTKAASSLIVSGRPVQTQAKDERCAPVMRGMRDFSQFERILMNMKAAKKQGKEPEKESEKVPEKEMKVGGQQVQSRSMDEFTYEELISWSRDRLRGALQALGLSCKGSRWQLITRLITRDRPTDEMCEEAGIKLSKIQKEDECSYPDDDTVTKILALHLVCTEEFHEAMGGTVFEPESFHLSKEWLSNVHIPGRYGRYQSFERWHKNAFRRIRPRVVAEAQHLYRELPSHLKVMGMNNVVSPAAISPLISNRVREDIFRYQEMRRRLLDTAKHCAQQQTAIQNCKPNSSFEQDSQHQQHIQVKLLLLQQTEIECRGLIDTSVLEPKIIDRIDVLLSRMTATELENPVSLSVLRAESRRTFKAAIAELSKRLEFETNYFFPELPVSPISRITPNTFNVKRVASQTGTESTLWSYGSFHDHATRLANRLQFLFDGVDPRRFQTNMRYFLGIQDRLPQLNSGQYPKRRVGRNSRRRKFFQSSDLLPGDLLHDNVYHGKTLLDTLLMENQEFLSRRRPDTPKYARKTWTRMLAILSLAYGLIDESAYLLSATERLLNDLSACFGMCEMSLPIPKQ